MFLVMLVVYAISAAAVMVLELAGFTIAAVSMFVISALHLHVSSAVGIVGVVLLAVGVAAVVLLLAGTVSSAYKIALAVLYEDQRVRIDGAGAQALGPA
jgi:hypothetical protein